MTELANSSVKRHNMAQSAVDSRKTTLHIDAFCEKPNITPTFSWDKWRQQWNLVLLAREGIQLETLLNGPPKIVACPPEPAYQEPMGSPTQVTERDRKVRNQ